jgi:hypothetical protein
MLMTKKASKVDKFSYLLRGWITSQSSGRDPPIWRFSLQDPSTGVRRGFASLEELIFFLERILIKGGPGSQDD